MSRPALLNCVAFIAASALLVGCWIFDTLAPPGCTVEPKDNSLLGFYAVRLRSTGSSWHWSGRCFQGGHYHYAFTVVVAVDVLDANMHVLERHYVPTFPGRLHHKYKDPGLGEFAVRPNQPPPQGAVVWIEAMSL